MKTVESTDSLTEITTKNTTEITLSVCSEESEIISLLKSRSDINQHTHNELITILNIKKNKPDFKFSIFKETLDLVDFEIQDLNYFKAALIRNLKKGYVRSTSNRPLSASKPIRTEILPDWFKENEYSVEPPPKKSKEELEKKRQEIADMLRKLNLGKYNNASV